MLQVLLFDYNIGKSSGSERQILGASSGRGCEDPSPTAFPRVGWVGNKGGTGWAAGVRKGSRAHGRCRGWLPTSPFVCDLKTQVTQLRLPGRWLQLQLWPLRSCVWLARGDESGRRAVPMAGHRVQRGRPQGLAPPATTVFVGGRLPTLPALPGASCAVASSTFPRSGLSFKVEGKRARRATHPHGATVLSDVHADTAGAHDWKTAVTVNTALCKGD